MIPKIIHRVWLSEELPDKNSKIGRPFYTQDKLSEHGYEIRTYTSKNIDLSMSKFLAQAYSLKRWAFATDYIRLWALYNFGGIYVDADVWIEKNFDELLDLPYFYGFESDWEDNNNPNNPSRHNIIDWGVIGVEKHNPIIKLFLDIYNSINFIDDDMFIHDKLYDNYGNYSTDIIPFRFNKLLELLNIKKICISDTIENYKNCILNNASSNNLYVLNTKWLSDSNYNKHKDLNHDCICIHERQGSWHWGYNILNKLTDYSIEQQNEYYDRYNKNKVTYLEDNVYILTSKQHDIIIKDFNIKESNIINDINFSIYNQIIINYDNIANMQLFKFLLKNLPDENCIITNNYEIINILDISLNNNLLIKVNKIDYKSVFKNVYENKLWASDGISKYYSGFGSHNITCMNNFLSFINNFIKENNVHSILDFGCGDFNIGRNIKVDMYYGTDIYDELINYNLEHFEDNTHKFIFNDESYVNLPSTDLIIIKEVLQHLDNYKIKEILDHLINITNRYILIIDSSLTENIENNINYNSYNINELILSKEISHYNFHPNKDPFNYNFTLVKRINKSVNAGYWNVWIYDKNIL